MKCTCAKALFCFVLCIPCLRAVGSGVTGGGSFVSVTNGVLYQLHYPRVTGLPVQQFNLPTSNSLRSPSQYDDGQSLIVTVGDSVYTVVLGETSLVCFKNSSTDPILQQVDTWSYPNGHRPTKLLLSALNPESFYLMFEEHLPLRFVVLNNELTAPQLDPDPEAISIVANSLHDDVIVTHYFDATLNFFSSSDISDTRLINLESYCSQFVSLTSLPPIRQDRNISFIANCTTQNGTEMFYHVLASYKSVDTLDVVPLVSGVPVASSRYLAIRSGSIVTVYNRYHLSIGTPQSHDFGSEVLMLVVFELGNHTSFVVYTADGAWRQIDAEEFFHNPAQGIRTLPGTLRGSCDQSVCPFVIVDNGFAVVSQNNVRYEIVLFSFESSVSTFTLTDRVTGLTQLPSFLTFVADPDAVSLVTTPTTSPTTLPTTLPTAPPTSPPTTPPITEVVTTESTFPPTKSDNESVITTSKPENSEQSVLEIALPVTLFAAISISLVILLVLLACKMCPRQKKDVFQPAPSRDDGKQSAITVDNTYSNPVPEVGDRKDSLEAASIAQETHSISNNSASLDAGYISCPLTPLPNRLLNSSSKQSMYSTLTCDTEPVFHESQD